ncbi:MULTISPECIES: hypothetical protein [unclassified Paenibacillus]|uniref:hypothetical protein n=1 Tax=unclassified Paenibacillus TaxID=185978 RepID=UPI000839B08D|nr:MULTISPECIES: hypothetical protein [unclassified Paenibacillus]NWL89227.1 hypothetical protein [Paenibacillus sp. 79R4]
MKRIGLILFILLLLNPLYARQTSALSCAELPSISEAYQRYDGVVTGRVESIRERRENNQIGLTITRSFKGITDQKLVIFEDKTWGAVSGPSILHGEYLFFLSYKEGTGWENPLCSPSKMAVNITSEESAFLDARELKLADEDRGAVAGSLFHTKGSYVLWGSVFTVVIVGISGYYLWINRRRS